MNSTPGGRSCLKMSRASSRRRLNFCKSSAQPPAASLRCNRHLQDSNMKELRGKAGESVLRVLYAFDPRRTAILLIGGDKSGSELWYEEFVSVADRLFDQH